MKTNKILVVAMMLAMAGATFTSCSKNDDEKMAEIVDDPIKATTEYYINGVVVDKENKAIEGVTVSTDGQSVKTDAKGNFTLTVKNIGTYTVSASMDGYLKTPAANVNMPQNTKNRASFNASFIMTKKVSAVSVAADNTADVVIATATNSNVESMDNVTSGLAVGIPGNSEGLAGSDIYVTEYLEEVSKEVADKNEASVSNIYVETSNNIKADGVTLAVKNPASAGAASFESFKVYKKTASRSGDDEEYIGDAVLNEDGKFEVKLTGGNLAGDYSFRVNYTSTTTTGKETQTGEMDNSGSLNAVNGYQINYTEKVGSTSNISGLAEGEDGMKGMIENTVKSSQGTTSVSDISKSLTTNISGNHILYYTIDNNYTVTTYTYTLSGGKTVTAEVKTYTGTTVNYQIESADKHSGGTADGE